MPSVTVHPPRTPVTKGSFGTAKNTIPNVCKMPGPPAPFVPTPLINIGMSGSSPQGYSTTVKIEGNTVAIRGATFGSFGDIVSKPLGGGIISMNTHGPTKFLGLGSFTVKIQGKNVQLLGDQMFNNCGPSGSPPNAATMKGVKQPRRRVSPARCKALKVRFGIHVAAHGKNTRGKTKKTSKRNQSHHIIQDAALDKFVARSKALAIMLRNSRGGTEHGKITKRQNNRRDNKKGGRGGPVPGVSFSDVKKQAKDDLAAGLEGRKDKEGRPMTKKEAKDAAACVIIEAERAAKSEAKKNKKKLQDNSRMKRPGGCFAAGTAVRLSSGEVRGVEWLRRGDWIDTPGGGVELTRVDTCHHDVVEVTLAGVVLLVASNHRLFDDAGEPVRADQLRAGDRIQSRSGLCLIERVRALAEPRKIYQLGVAGRSACMLSAAGILAELPDAGPPLEPYEFVIPFTPEESRCPS